MKYIKVSALNYYLIELVIFNYILLNIPFNFNLQYI